MSKITTTGELRPTALPTWQDLEQYVRAQMQTILEQLLEAEVAEFLGRVKSARRAGPDAPAGDRNGYGKPRRVALLGGTIEGRRPRLRDLSTRFESRVLPFFKRRTDALGAEPMALYPAGPPRGDGRRAEAHRNGRERAPGGDRALA